MSVTVKAIPATNKAITDYVKFGIDLYDGNEQFVPPMIFDEVHTLLPDKNPAFDYCRAQCFMAYRDGKPVGRITALVNDQINEKLNKKEARFGFVDFIDDKEVVDALFKAAEDWAKNEGMTEIIGPMGFSDIVKGCWWKDSMRWELWRPFIITTIIPVISNALATRKIPIGWNIV